MFSLLSAMETPYDKLLAENTPESMKIIAFRQNCTYTVAFAIRNTD